MATALGLSDIINHEVKINVETANQIFIKCFAQANIVGKKLMPNTLAAAIDAAFTDSPITADFIRNKYSKLEKMLKENIPNQKISFFHIFIYTLARYAGIDDYKAFDRSFENGIEVLCAPRPFKLLNLLRLVENGNIVKSGTGWQYTNNEGNINQGETEQVELYTMKGDQHPLWLRVSYIYAGNKNTLFFAQMTNGEMVVQYQTSRLYRFFI